MSILGIIVRLLPFRRRITALVQLLLLLLWLRRVLVTSTALAQLQLLSIIAATAATTSTTRIASTRSTATTTTTTTTTLADLLLISRVFSRCLSTTTACLVCCKCDQDEEDDFDRLPMPKGGVGHQMGGACRVPLSFFAQGFGTEAVRRPVGQIEEIDLKLPPKPMSETIAEKVEKSKKVEKKKEDRQVALASRASGASCFVFFGP